MATHAGFAIVASARQGYINSLLHSAFANIGPFFFPLPQTISVGGFPVSFGGIAQVAIPVLECHPNPGNTIRGHFAFFTIFTAKIGGLPSNRWHVRLDVTADVALTIAPINGQLVLQALTSTVVLQPLTVTFLQGPPPPSVVVTALQSTDLANAATAAINALPPFALTALTDSYFTITEPGHFKDSNFSVFEWFSVHLQVSRTVLRVFEDAVTIAADFSQITSGDENALADLTRTHGGGSVYVETITDNTDLGDPGYERILVETSYSAGANIAMAFNMAVVSRVVSIISTQTASTPISKQAVLRWISAGYSRFEMPFRGQQDSLGILIDVFALGFTDALVTVNLQPFLRVYDRSTGVGTEGWQLFVARVDVALPWQVDFLIGIAHVLAVAVGMSITLPVAIFGYKWLPVVTKLFDDIDDAFAKGDPDNIAAAQKLTLQGSAYDAKLPFARYISVTADAIDMGFGTGKFPPLSLAEDPATGASISPLGWTAIDRRPIQTAVTLDSNWLKLVRNNLQAVWEVRRKDTNAVIITASLPYNAATGNGVSIPHHSEALYLVSEFVVRCSLTMTLGDQTGEIWSGVQNIKVDDDLDRSHSYVEWGAEYVYFSNPGTITDGVQTTWVRLSRSRIHRTAVAARCKMVRIAASDRVYATQRELETGRYVGQHPKFRYKDNLPFNPELLNQHRKELCEYCFFGGPDKTEPFPAEDWFEPHKPFQKVTEHIFP